jgi:hypothetical protein
MLAEKRLSELGFTLSQAIDFINTNVNQPQIIFDVASEHGVNTRMLSEISGYSKDVVHEYFLNAGYDSATINTQLNTNLLVNSNLGSLESLVAFNEREGVLSNASLREVVKPTIDANYDYDGTFGPANLNQSDDGVYSSGELGVENLNDVLATQIGFIDSRNGAVVHMINEAAELTLTSNDPRIPQYKKITAINIVPISGVVEGAQNCNYIHVDAQTALICEKSGNDNTDTSIPPIGNELIKSLETTIKKVAKATEFEIGYVIATDAASGNAKIFRSEDYVAISPALPRLPQSLPELRTPITLYVITEEVNPCCTDVYSGGTWYRVCVKAASC